MAELAPVVGHAIRIALSAPFVSYIKRLNHLTITGQEHIPGTPNTLFVANHRSFIDPFLVGFAGMGYAAIWQYHLSPYSPIAADVVTTPFRKFIIYNMLRCIPVNRGHFNQQTHDTMVDCLRRNTMILFPEGGITPDGRVREQGRPGVGSVIYSSRCTVIPIYHHGLEQIVPVWASRFYWGKDVYCRVGEPLDFTDEFAQPDERPTWERIVAKVMGALHDMEARFVAETGRSLDLPRRPGR